MLDAEDWILVILISLFVADLFVQSTSSSNRGRLGTPTALCFSMKTMSSAPLLSRVKSWELVGLGISGWIAIYSAAVISWGASSFIIGNAQGGCFAATMTLAGLEVRRYKKGSLVAPDPLKWADGITIRQLNQSISQSLMFKRFRVEAPHPTEAEMGFGLRAIIAGRTVVFETDRWKEPVIDLLHARTTDENRKAARADIAVLVGAGTPDEDTEIFVKTHPIKLMVGQELKNLLASEIEMRATETALATKKDPVKTAEA